jgi:hypothetical protein
MWRRCSVVVVVVVVLWFCGDVWWRLWLSLVVVAVGRVALLAARLGLDNTERHVA